MDMQTVIEELRRRGRNMVALDTPQKQDLADVGADFAAGFIPVLAQAQALRDFERSRRAQDPAGMAMASAGLIPFGKLLTAALRRSNPVISQIDVYHGTPHRFPATEANPLGEFDASKIGTGEGAQAYGHGIYFAESPKVAKTYTQEGMQVGPVFGDVQFHPEVEKEIRNLSEIAIKNKNQEAEWVFDELLIGDFSPDILRQMAKTKTTLEGNEFDKKKVEQALETAKTVANKSFGSLYKADLPDEMIDRMLDYDKPINEQNSAVLDALEKAGINTQSTALAGPMAQGQEAHLAKHGIPGIKYLDAGSRDNRSGTRNFVVFPGEEKKVKILERK